MKTLSFSTEYLHDHKEALHLEPGLREATRLVVLVPEGDFDENALARRIWELVDSSSLAVLFLALAPNDEGISTQMRRLITLASLNSVGHQRPATKLSEQKNWLEAVRDVLGPRDLLVSLAGHRAPGLWGQRKSLGERLSDTLHIPTLVLDGLPVGPSPKRDDWIKNVLAWVGSLVVMSGFFGLQAQIDLITPRPYSMALLFMSIVVEIALIVKINEWIG